MSNTAERIHKRFLQESEKQIDLVMGSTALALHRHNGWGKQRVSDTLDMIQEAWNECAADRSISMIAMLENETGIELKPSEHDKSWRELDYLNGNTHRRLQDMTASQIIYMRNQQIRWIETQVMASCFLALHRKCGFGPKRITDLLQQIRDIESEYKYNRRKILEALEKETGIIFRQGTGKENESRVG